MKKPKFQSPTGMHDILPEDQSYFQRVEKVVRDIADFYHFKKIDTPILEESELFSRGIGTSTDIIGKQMFGLRTRGGDYLTLRPEGTASVVRAFIEHGMQNLPQPVKLWYWGPFFRYEKPQTGRYRQFWQFGFEVFGEEGAVIDAQIIQIFCNILKELKLTPHQFQKGKSGQRSPIKNGGGLVVGVNSIGAGCCRSYYKKVLTNYLKARIEHLCLDCKRRIKENPLRVLDCKEEKCQPIINQAPQLVDHLCEDCHNHFREVLEFLEEIEIVYHLNPYLVRGLDYYTKTVFEIFEDSPEIKNLGALVGGGRYDMLVKLLRGKNTPAVGGAAGIERIIQALKIKQIHPKITIPPKVYLAQLGNLAKRKSLKLLEEFRKTDISTAESLGRNSLKVQLARADKIGVQYTLIFGQKEALEGTIIIRDMKTGRQETIKLEKAVEEMSRRLKKS